LFNLTIAPRQQVQAEFGFPVLSIVRLQHIITYVKESAASDAATAAGGGRGVEGGADNQGVLHDIQLYREQYGVQY
jgi:hypothetical protein